MKFDNRYASPVLIFLLDTLILDCVGSILHLKLSWFVSELPDKDIKTLLKYEIWERAPRLQIVATMLQI